MTTTTASAPTSTAKKAKKVHIYMDFPGLKGEVVDKNYQGKIALEGVHFQTTRDINQDVGSGRARELSKPHITQMTIYKRVDSASIGLFGKSVKGTDAAKQVTITFTRTGASGSTAYFGFTLDNVLVSSYELVSGNMNGDDEEPMEKITLAFTVIEESYHEMGADGKTTAQSTEMYNLLAGE